MGSFLVVSAALVAVQSNGIFALPGLLIIRSLYSALVLTSRSTREIKRMSNNATSPLLSTLNEIKSGQHVVRAPEAQPHTPWPALLTAPMASTASATRADPISPGPSSLLGDMPDRAASAAVRSRPSLPRPGGTRPPSTSRRADV